VEPEKFYVFQMGKLLIFNNYQEVVYSLKKGDFGFFNFIYKTGDRDWLRILNHPLFAKELDKMPDVFPDQLPMNKYQSRDPIELVVAENQNLSKSQSSSVPFIRLYERAAFSASALMYGDQYELSGNCTVIGQGGCFFETSLHGLKRGMRFKLKILPGIIPQVIEAEVEISSVITKAPKGLGLRFINIHPDSVGQIQLFVDRYLANSRRQS
jgi:hypothetical protein